jgi:hypothetical protein
MIFRAVSWADGQATLSLDYSIRHFILGGQVD